MRHSFGIDSKGNVYACNSLFLPFGNILTEDINKIWSSEGMTKIRNLRYADLKDCSDCKKEKKCIRCPGVSFTETGDILKKYDYACKIANLR